MHDVKIIFPFGKEYILYLQLSHVSRLDKISCLKFAVLYFNDVEDVYLETTHCIALDLAHLLR